ncbi:hypothetical protein D3C71_24850 [compost metagenome]
MFSLIIAIISIVLVAALAIAVIYYGSTAFNKGAAAAEASKVLVQGQQLLGAADMHYADHNIWPSLAELESKDYLNMVPSVSARGAAVPWTTPLERRPVFLLQQNAVSEEVCLAINERGSLKRRAIPVHAYTALLSQCYGVKDDLKVLVKKYGTDVSLGAPPGESDDIPAEEVVVGTPPATGSPGDGVWTVPPSGPGPTNPGGGQPGGEDPGGGTPGGSTGPFPIDLGMGWSIVGSDTGNTLDLGTHALGQDVFKTFAVVNNSSAPGYWYTNPWPTDDYPASYLWGLDWHPQQCGWVEPGQTCYFRLWVEPASTPGTYQATYNFRVQADLAPDYPDGGYHQATFSVTWQ